MCVCAKVPGAFFFSNLEFVYSALVYKEEYWKILHRLNRETEEIHDAFVEAKKERPKRLKSEDRKVKIKLICMTFSVQTLLKSKYQS